MEKEDAELIAKFATNDMGLGMFGSEYLSGQGRVALIRGSNEYGYDSYGDSAAATAYTGKALLGGLPSCACFG